MAEDDDLIDPRLRFMGLAQLKSEGDRIPYDHEASFPNAFPDEDDVPLSTGRTIYANRGILGLGPDGGLYEGYDGGVDADLTPAERREIAEMMIARWHKFGGIDG